MLYEYITIVEKEPNNQTLVIKETLNIIEKIPNPNIKEENFKTSFQLYKSNNTNINQYNKVLPSSSLNQPNALSSQIGLPQNPTL